MARLTPTVITSPIASEAGTQMATVPAQTMTDGTEYLVNLTRGDVLIVFDNNTLGATTITVTSYADKSGRLANISKVVNDSDKDARIFSANGWVDENGDMHVTSTGSDVDAYVYLIK